MAIACLCLLTLPAATARPHTADEIEYFAYLRSLWFDRDVSFDNEYRYFFDRGYTTDPGFKATFIDGRTVTDHAPSFATLGAAILWAPFYAAADVGVRFGRAAGWTALPADGYSRPYLLAVAWGSVCYGWLALALSAHLSVRLIGRGRAAAVAVALGTPLVFYMYAQPGFAHACSAFVVALFIWTWVRVRDRWSIGGVTVLSALAALMTMVREQDAFLILVPAVDFVRAELRARAGASRLMPALVRSVAAAATFAACFMPQALAYLALNGRIGPSPIVANKMYWTAPWAADVVFSSQHGWLAWTPLVCLAVAGLVGMVAIDRSRTVRDVGAMLLLAIATQVYVSGSVATWSLAGAFGQRRFTGVTLCLVVGLAWLQSWASTARARGVLVQAAVVAAVWWNLGLAFQFGERSMDRQRLDLPRNAYATFVELPRRVPALIYRYVFDRGSFYAAQPAGQ